MFTVFFMDNRGWRVTSEYDTPERALEAQTAFRSQGMEAYAVNISTVMVNMSAFSLKEVERICKRPFVVKDLTKNGQVIKTVATNQEAWQWLQAEIGEGRMPGRFIAQFLVDRA
jgi:hypothetical protein